MLFNPSISGDSRDKTRFAKELIRVAVNRQPAFAFPEIQIHTRPHHGRATSDLREQLEGNIEHVGQALRPAHLEAASWVRVLIRTALLDRYLIAGKLAKNEDDVPVTDPKWFIHLGIVGEPLTAAPPTMLTTRSLLGCRDWNQILRTLPGMQKVLLEIRVG